MKYSKPMLLLGVLLLAFILLPRAYASPVVVAITPTSQPVPQGSLASYTIGLSSAAKASYQLSLSGLVPGASAAFSPNPVSTPPGTGIGAGSATLTIDTRSTPLYCPGVYSFTVSATNATGLPTLGVAADPGSASGTLIVLQVGPNLGVTASTDKPTYRIGDKVTILLSASRPAEGRLTISAPSGTPQIFDYELIYGSYSLSRTFTANAIGHWVGSFQADDFCAGFSSAQFSFDVTPDTYDVSISLNNVPSQYSAQVKVNDQPQGTIGGAEIKKYSFKIDTSNTISVDQYVSGDEGVRYFAQQNTWSVNSAGTHTFDYKIQYLVTVTTDPEGITPVTGGGWVDAGSAVQTNQVPVTVPGTAGTQYAFKGWEVNGVAQSGNGISLTADKPIKAVAKYETRYQLLIDSPYGDPKGQGYYPAGSTATFSVTSPWGFPVQQIFVRWTGAFTGTSPQGTVTMDGSKVIHASWSPSYILLAAIIIIAAAAVGGFLLWRKRRGPAPTKKPTPGEGVNLGDVCDKCGTENPAGQKFCTQCGKKLSKPKTKK